MLTGATLHRSRAFALAVAIGLMGVVGASQPSLASTIGFGTSAGNFTPYVESGFTLDTARIVSDGKCSGSPCMGLNTNETSTLTRVGGSAFTLDGFSFVLVGNPALLTVTAFLDSTPTSTFSFNTANFSKNDEHVFAFSVPVSNITSLVFTDTGTGNVRVDNIDVVPDAITRSVPVPVVGAGLPGLMVAFGGLFALARRRRRKAA